MRYYFGILCGIVAALISLEIVFQALPVNSGARKAATDAATPYCRYLPNQDYVYSYGWAFLNHRSGVTTHEGFVNTHDYQSKGGVLVLGDSFVEAFMLPYENTMQGYLDEALHGNVYTAACSGNKLPDSLMLAKQFASQLDPKVVVVFVKPYEMNMLLAPAHPGFNGFVDDDHTFKVEHLPYVESKMKALILHSALIRYVYYNLKLPEWIATAMQAKMTFQLPDSIQLPEWLTKAMKFSHGSDQSLVISSAQKDAALNYYFVELRKALPQQRIIFMIDGDRESMYKGKVDATHQVLQDDSLLFEKQAAEHGFEFVDMEPIQMAHWRTYHERMDFLPVDGHWNQVSHRLAAEAILKKLGAQ